MTTHCKPSVIEGDNGRERSHWLQTYAIRHAHCELMARAVFGQMTWQP